MQSQAITVFKQLISYHPDHILTLPTVTEMTMSNTRQRNNLYVPRTNTDIGARSMNVLGTKLWNNLPTAVKQSTNNHTLKLKLKQGLKKV